MMKMKQSFPGKVCLLVLFVIFSGAQLFARKVTDVVVARTSVLQIEEVDAIGYGTVQMLRIYSLFGKFGLLLGIPDSLYDTLIISN